MPKETAKSALREAQIPQEALQIDVPVRSVDIHSVCLSFNCQTATT